MALLALEAPAAAGTAVRPEEETPEEAPAAASRAGEPEYPAENDA
jgi:hypothetical protein